MAEVQRIVPEMPLNRSPGIVYILTRVLQDCLSVIVPTLTNIVNTTLMPATFPTGWDKTRSRNDGKAERNAKAERNGDKTRNGMAERNGDKTRNGMGIKRGMGIRLTTI